MNETSRKNRFAILLALGGLLIGSAGLLLYGRNTAAPPSGRSLRRQIDEERNSGRYAEARRTADRLIGLLQHHHPPLAWQLLDARLLTATLDTILTLPPDDREEMAAADRLTQLSDQESQTGTADSAIMLAKEQLRIRQEYLGEDHIEVAQSLNRLAAAYTDKGDYVAAEPLFLRARGILLAVAGQEHPALAENLFGHGRLLSYRHDFGAAKELMEEASNISRSAWGAGSMEYAGALIAQARNLREMGERQTALNLYKKSYEIQRHHPDRDSLEFANLEHSLGNCYAQMQDYRTAEPLLLDALKTRRRHWLGPNAQVAWNLNDLGYLYSAQRKDDLAVSYFGQAQAMFRQALGPNHPLLLTSLFRTSACRLRQGRMAEAESLLVEMSIVYERARQRVGTDYSRSTFYGSPYGQLAVLRLRRGREEEAWPMVERYQGRALADMLLASRGPALNAQTSFSYEDSLRRALAQVERALQEEKEMALGKGHATDGDHVRTLRARYARTQAAWIMLKGEISTTNPIPPGDPFSLEKVQSVLDRQTALIGWLNGDWGNSRGVNFAYVVRHVGPVRWINLGITEGPVDPARVATDLVEALATASSWPTRLHDASGLLRPARSLARSCIDPLRPCLAGVRQLVVIPSGPILGIPVEMLPDSTGAFPLDEYSISYTPSATVFTWLAQRKASGKPAAKWKALLVGDPPMSAAQRAEMEPPQTTHVLPGEGNTKGERANTKTGFLRSALDGDTAALSRLPRLYSTRNEIRRIADMFPNPTVLLGGDASEERIRGLATARGLRPYDYLHFATHALVDDACPERSALVLSQVHGLGGQAADSTGGSGYDGLLTAQEIARDCALDAEMVVLSGCLTGLGRRSIEEGYIGLANAFLLAGARSLLVSIWRVDDSATALLMQRFCQNLTGAYADERGKGPGDPFPKAAALREAKRWLRGYTDTEGRHPYSHPIYWAGFVLIGNPR